jgi:hypothetical protein
VQKLRLLNYLHNKAPFDNRCQFLFPEWGDPFRLNINFLPISKNALALWLCVLPSSPKFADETFSISCIFTVFTFPTPV